MFNIMNICPSFVYDYKYKGGSKNVVSIIR